MSTDLDREIWIEVCPLEELEREGVKVVSGEGRPVAIFFDQGRVYALDNRCPHMGFPLRRGTGASGRGRVWGRRTRAPKWGCRGIGER